MRRSARERYNGTAARRTEPSPLEIQTAHQRTLPWYWRAQETGVGGDRRRSIEVCPALTLSISSERCVGQLPSQDSKNALGREIDLYSTATE